MHKSVQNSSLFLIIISILCFNLKTTVLQFEYSFFNESFTEIFCENKEKPELKCNGQCHLKKISNEQDNDHSTKKITVDTEILFLNTVEIYSFTCVLPLQKAKIYSKKDLFRSVSNYPLKHPPQVLV